MSKLKSIKDFKQEVSCLNDNQLSNVFGGLTDGGEFGGGDGDAGTWEYQIGSETSMNSTGRCDHYRKKKPDGTASYNWSDWYIHLD